MERPGGADSTVWSPFCGKHSGVRGGPGGERRTAAKEEGGTRMNFSSMDYFVMVARERSFSRAAERLHITQQTLSAHIAKLEGELGTKLLVRSIPLELTYAGEVFLEYALDLQRRVNSLEREFQDISENQRGLLRIGITYTRGDVVMPPLLMRFQSRYPNITVRLVGDINANFFGLLENGEIDLAIAPFPTAAPGIELVDFYQEEIVLLVPKDILARLGAEPGSGAFARIENGDLSPLRDCPFILAAQQESNGIFGYDLLRRWGIVPIPKIEVHHTTVRSELVLAVSGMGACFAPQNMIRPSLTPQQEAQLELIHLGEEARHMIHFGYLKQPHQWSVITDFIHMAQEMSGEFEAKK